MLCRPPGSAARAAGSGAGLRAAGLRRDSVHGDQGGCVQLQTKHHTVLPEEGIQVRTSKFCEYILCRYIFLLHIIHIYKRLDHEITSDDRYSSFKQKVLRQYKIEEVESAFKILDSLTKKIFVKNNKKIITDPAAEMLRIRRYEAADDLETVRSIINDAYVRVHDKLGLQRVVRLPSVEDIVPDNLYLATMGREVVGAMVITPTSDGALIGHIM